MRVAIRVAAFSFVALLLGAGVSAAGPINVAEFNWTATIVDPNPNCDASDTACIPDPFYLSVFQLTNLWDGPDPAPALTGNRLTLADGDLDWFDLAPPFPADGTNIDQLSLFGPLPGFAIATVSFLFDGQLMSLSGRLDAADTSVVLRFDAPDPAPVPEPATVTLVAVGLVLLVARFRRASATQF